MIFAPSFSAALVRYVLRSLRPEVLLNLPPVLVLVILVALRSLLSSAPPILTVAFEVPVASALRASKLNEAKSELSWMVNVLMLSTLSAFRAIKLLLPVTIKLLPVVALLLVKSKFAVSKSSQSLIVKETTFPVAVKSVRSPLPSNLMVSMSAFKLALPKSAAPVKSTLLAVPSMVTLSNEEA